MPKPFGFRGISPRLPVSLRHVEIWRATQGRPDPSDRSVRRFVLRTRYSTVQHPY